MKLIYDKEKNIGIGIDIQNLQEVIKQKESRLSSVQRISNIFIKTQRVGRTKK